MSERASGTNRIRLLIADDHTLFRHGIRALLASVPDIELVGEAAGGEEAVALATQLEPDVILMDIKMPGTNGIEATRRIMQTNPAARVVVLTMLEDDDSVFAAIRAGARGYVVKGADEAEMLRVVRAAANGEALFGPAIAGRLMGFFSGAGSPRGSQPFPDLTERERDVLGLIARGHSNAEIARALWLSPYTVADHVKNVFEKTGVRSRGELTSRLFFEHYLPRS